VKSQHLGGSQWLWQLNMLPHAICTGDNVPTDAEIEMLSKMHHQKCTPDGRAMLSPLLVVAVAVFSVFLAWHFHV